MQLKSVLPASLEKSYIPVTQEFLHDSSQVSSTSRMGRVTCVLTSSFPYTPILLLAYPGPASSLMFRTDLNRVSEGPINIGLGSYTTQMVINGSLKKSEVEVA